MMSRTGKSVIRRIFKGFGIFAGALVALLVVLQIVLSNGVATGLVNRFAADYVDGTLSFGKVSVNVFNRFPAVSLTLEDAALTYPHERFDSLEREYAAARLMGKGRSEAGDTLAAFHELTVAVNVLPYITAGKIDLKKAILDRPKVFAKIYPGDRRNWDMFRFSPETDEEDTTSTPLPPIRVRSVALTGNPDVVLCSLADTLFATLRLKSMSLKGSLETEDLLGSEGQFRIDSLFVAGRFRRDTLMFALDNLSLKEHDRTAHFKLDSKAYLRTRSFGRLQVPFNVDALAEFPCDSVLSVSLKKMDAVVAGIPFKAFGNLRVHSDRYYVNGELGVDGCRLKDMLRNYADGIVEEAKYVQTDAVLTVTALADGYWAPELGLVPSLAAEVLLPEAEISHDGYGVKGKLALHLEADADANQPVNVSVDQLLAEIPGLSLDAVAKASDLLGKDPLFDVDMDARLKLDSLIQYLPADKGYSASGMVDACLVGKIRKSQLNLAKVSRANLSGLLHSDGIQIASENDSLSAQFGCIDAELAACGNKYDDSVSKNARMLVLLFDVDTLSAKLGTSVTAQGHKFHLKAQNSADILDSRKKAAFYPFMGELSVGSALVNDSDSLVIVLSDSRNHFRISPKKNNPAVPVLRLDSGNGAVYLRSVSNRIGARNLKFDATAAMNSLERKIRLRALTDSLARVYPDVARDSLLRYHFRRMNGTSPKWMASEPAAGDIDFGLSETIRKYYRDWDISGRIDLEKAFLASPMFPLKNTLENVSGHFTNDRVDLDSFVLHSGSSDMHAQGAIHGLRRAILGHGIINLDLNVNSELLNANELLGAYDAGRKVDVEELAKMADLSDDEFQAACVQDVGEIESGLFVVPGNVRADVRLEAKRIIYSTLDIDWMETEISVRDRCVQVANTVATSNMGDIYFEGFYSTANEKDAKTGFFLNLVDITAEKVIELMPQVDTIIPMLKSFYGLLDCTLAATAGLDENMNVIMPSVNGVTRITGKNLEIRDDKDISSIARILMFKDKKTIHVDKMSVEGLLEDSRLEVFPFMLNVDRYQLALSGIQNMDMSFRYHVSVIRSPLVFKFGIDLYGNFDSWKYKIGKAKYRSEKSVPVFTRVIDQSTLNLTNSIHAIFEKGVDAAVAENEAQKAISEFKDNTNYVAVADQPLDELSQEESEKLKEMEAQEE